MSKHFEYLAAVIVLVAAVLSVHFARHGGRSVEKTVPAVEVTSPLPKVPVADELSPLPAVDQSAGHWKHLRQLDEHEAKIRSLSLAQAVAAVA